MTATIKMTAVNFSGENTTTTCKISEATAEKINNALKENGFCYGFTNENIFKGAKLEALKANSYDHARITIQ